MTIHPLAVVHPQAHIGVGVKIGPFAIVEQDVVIGDHCEIAGHAVIKDGVNMGASNLVGEGSVIGGMPQHLKCPREVGRVSIGDNNTFREFTTVHRALKTDAVTTIGSDNYLMANAHVAHDCNVANNVVMANNVLLAGHVTVGDRAFLSGHVAIHQFCRIGSMAMIGGHARVVRDVPPYIMIDGNSGDVVGLNIVGLKRNGFTLDAINQLKSAYRVIYRSGLNWKDMLARLAEVACEGPAASMLEFFQGGTRGFSQERRAPPGATLKLHTADREAAPRETAERPAAQSRSLMVLPAPERQAKAG